MGNLLFILSCSLCLLLVHQAQGDVSLRWQYLDLGDDIGDRPQVLVGDFDGSGYPETYVIANDYKDIMAVQYDGENYDAEKKLPRPTSSGGSELTILSLGLLSTDSDYGLVACESTDPFFIYDLATAELVDTFEIPGSGSGYYVGAMDLAEPGAAYSITSKLVVVHGDKVNGFYTKTYEDMINDPGAITGSFTSAGVTQIVYSNGTMFEYNEESDSFDQIQGFPFALSTETTPLMIPVDVDDDGIHEIVSRAGIGLECYSALDFGIIWTLDVTIITH